MRIVQFGFLILLACLCSCGGGGGSTLTTATPSGAYEFVVTSNVTGGTTLVEANLSANANQSSASGPSQIQVVTFEKKLVYINGVCPGNDPGQNGVTASVSGKNNVAVTFNDGGNLTNGTGSLIGTTIAGSYSVSGSNCADLSGNLGYPNGYDSGGFTGNSVPSLSGSFAGVLDLPEGAENAEITVQESNNQTLSVQATLNGSGENGSFVFSGSAAGNVMLVTATINGNSETWFGLFDSTGRFSGIGNSILIFDYNTLTKAGVLLKQ